MKLLDLFSGTQSVASVFRERGWETYTIELDKSHDGIDWYEDIMKITAKDILDRFGVPDVIWASPPCTTYSVSSIRYHRRKGDNGNLYPTSEFAAQSDELVKHTIALIKELNPKFYFIENPRGALRKMDFMQELPRFTVTYCQYGSKLMKPTDIWTNMVEPKFLPMCTIKAPCHTRSPRGSQNGIQGMRDAKLKSIIPSQLCIHVADRCEEELCVNKPI